MRFSNFKHRNAARVDGVSFLPEFLIGILLGWLRKLSLSGNHPNQYGLLQNSSSPDVKTFCLSLSKVVKALTAGQVSWFWNKLHGHIVRKMKFSDNMNVKWKCVAFFISLHIPYDKKKTIFKLIQSVWSDLLCFQFYTNENCIENTKQLSNENRIVCFYLNLILQY